MPPISVERRARLRAARRVVEEVRQLAEIGWTSIRECPPEEVGTAAGMRSEPVLLGHPEIEEPAVGEIVRFEDGSVGTFTMCGSAGSRLVEPTHWRRLPPPPVDVRRRLGELSLSLARVPQHGRFVTVHGETLREDWIAQLRDLLFEAAFHGAEVSADQLRDIAMYTESRHAMFIEHRRRLDYQTAMQREAGLPVDRPLLIRTLALLKRARDIAARAAVLLPPGGNVTLLPAVEAGRAEEVRGVAREWLDFLEALEAAGENAERPAEWFALWARLREVAEGILRA